MPAAARHDAPASAPAGLGREDIPADLVEAEKDIFRKQMEGQNKPADILEKIISGKLGKFYSEHCLLEQGFVKDPDTTVQGLLEAQGKEVGDTLAIDRFVRFQLGEGIEKEESDFAAEVAAAVKG